MTRYHKELAKLSFDQICTKLSGEALEEFIRGTPFRAVISNVVAGACAWRMNRPDMKEES